jgi:hypothetical protein
MMKEWHFNVLFFVGVLGAVVMLIGPEIGLDIGKNPTAVTGVGAILGYILTQKPKLIKQPPEDHKSEEKDKPKEEGGG